ncbi:hypothetical protein B9Z19DRAFT_1134958 [Tuber borchii]|uniref:Uncharacterized protein n=1 Tax=Tuber borchii TaxID=42251 RepID=A0A2T6ZDK4_TUBBO|nr:hypothetical protein B9Z19DRAFT_1134958 [Tuber borchii]
MLSTKLVKFRRVPINYRTQLLASGMYFKRANHTKSEVSHDDIHNDIPNYQGHEEPFHAEKKLGQHEPEKSATDMSSDVSQLKINAAVVNCHLESIKSTLHDLKERIGVDHVDHGDNNPPWWIRSVQDLPEQLKAMGNRFEKTTDDLSNKIDNKIQHLDNKIGHLADKTNRKSDKMGRCKTVQLSGAVNCLELFADHAQRWLTLSVTHNFNRGRKIQFIVICFLYIVCRHEKSAYMLIDFTGILNASIQLEFDWLLSANSAPDPTVYVYRPAKHLHFASELTKITNDALCIVQRMSRD